MLRQTGGGRFRNVVVRARALAVRAGYGVGRLLPRRGDIVLATSHADTIGGNLAAIRDEAARRSPAVPTRTVAHRVRSGVIGAIAEGWHGARAGYAVARARLVIVDDYFFPLYAVPRRRETTVVQVWHACGAFKKFGYSVLDKSFGATADAVRDQPIHTGYDLCLVSSRRAIPAYAEAFRQPPELFVSELGIPRTDALLDASRRDGAVASVRRRHRIPSGKRVVLYAPTFRGDATTEARPPPELELHALHATIGADHVVLLRRHPFVRARAAVPGDLADFAIDVSDDPDINDLMLASDVLVTDYSSAIFEFALLGRPIGFLAPDHAAYERERGFYLDFPADLPGPVFEDAAALTAWLRAGLFDLAAVRDFARAWFDVADGRASARFIDRVALPALAGVHVTPNSLRSATTLR
jgi:teichoic acid ribitol-phosphate primase